MESNLSVAALRIWALGFTSIAIGALLMLALCLGQARGARQLRLALILACLSAVCTLATHGPFALLVLWEAGDLALPDEVRLLFVPFGEALIGLLWLSLLILFEDTRITPFRFAPTALLMAISAASLLTGLLNQFGWMAATINLALAGHAFARVAHGWRDDLVERRRRLRRPFLAVLGLALGLVIIVQGMEFAGRAGQISDTIMIPIYATLNIALAIMALSVGVLFLEPRAALVAEPPPSSQRVETDSEDNAMAKLESLMTQREIWRREGLSVGALAAEVGLPEHRLRVLINGRLGHRNFAAFVNARRIEAARRQLADPAFVDTPISKIAYDLGFSSLGPFNRAFKEAAGVTPTEWRRSKLPS